MSSGKYFDSSSATRKPFAKSLKRNKNTFGVCAAGVELKAVQQLAWSPFRVFDRICKV